MVEFKVFVEPGGAIWKQKEVPKVNCQDPTLIQCPKGPKWVENAWLID